MILVDPLFACAPCWGGRKSCHMMSDRDVGELLDFAKGIGLPLAWFQARSSVPHFDLSPRWRSRAIAAGALEVDRRGFVDAMQRWRTARATEVPPGPRG